MITFLLARLAYRTPAGVKVCIAPSGWPEHEAMRHREDAASSARLIEKRAATLRN